MRGRIGKGTKTWDLVCLPLFGLAIVAIMIVGALDAGRYQWSGMADWLWPVGLAAFMAGQALLTGAMVANPFFEKTARIQKDRSHRVIDSGPYAHVRHSGYTGIIIGLILGSPLILGSWWAFVPAVIAAFALMVRAGLEDRMLLGELDGYKAYAGRVRYRLVPHIW